MKTRRKKFQRLPNLLFVMVYLAVFAGMSGLQAASTENLLKVQQAYVAYYGRPADPAGQDYWANRLEQEGGSLQSIIQAFGNSQEFQERFGSMSKEQLVNNIYRQLFNRDAEPMGLAFYVGKLQSGEMTLQTICLNILDGAQGDDLATIQNKVQVAQYFTQQLREHPNCRYEGNEAAERAKRILSFVNAAPGSVNAGKIGTDYAYCGILRCPQNPEDSLEALSPDQQAFITSRGNPHLFFILIETEKISTDTHRLVYDGTARRLETWYYNTQEGMKEVKFDNGFFVEEKVVGPYLENLAPTHWSPALFTPCTTKDQVERILGQPSCVLQTRLGGRIFAAMRYNPSTTQPAGTVYTENDLVVQVEAGLVLAPPGTNDLCNLNSR